MDSDFDKEQRAERERKLYMPRPDMRRLSRDELERYARELEMHLAFAYREMLVGGSAQVPKTNTSQDKQGENNA